MDGNPVKALMALTGLLFSGAPAGGSNPFTGSITPFI
jgi:hypothetical protein